MTEAVVIISAFFISGIISYLVLGKHKMIDFEKKQRESEELLEKSKKEAEEIFLGTKERVKSFEERSAQELERMKRHAEKSEQSIQRKELYAKKHEERNKEIERKVVEIEKNTKEIERKNIELEKAVTQKLATKIGTTEEKEKSSFLNRMERQTQVEDEDRLQQLQEQLKENAEKEAKEILTSMMQRLASPTSVEKKGEQIKVPKDHIKAKIVGDKAQTIELLEELLEVNIIFNDLPSTITVASYHLLNQHIAAKTIRAIINQKGLITKEVVVRVVAEARKETENELEKMGKEIADKLNLRIKSKKLYELIGRLKFRTSYGQNILKHSLEVGWISMMLGSELGLDVEVCKTAGFLHDLGKAIDQDKEIKDAHDVLTKELMEELGFNEAEVHAAWAHHEAVPARTPEARIVQAADAVSAGRPGARQETLEKYLARLRQLEDTANSFEGVRKSFAISAGREIRVIVDPDRINDKGVKDLAKNIAAKIENEMGYPGKIKVNVIRKIKAFETAR